MCRFCRQHCLYFRLIDSSHFLAVVLECKGLHCADASAPGSAGDGLFRLSFRKLDVAFPSVVLYHFWSGKGAQRHNYTPNMPPLWTDTLQYCRVAWICFSRWGIEGFLREKVFSFLGAVLQPQHWRVCVCSLVHFPVGILAEKITLPLARGCSLSISIFVWHFPKGNWSNNWDNVLFWTWQKSSQNLPCKRNLKENCFALKTPL